MTSGCEAVGFVVAVPVATAVEVAVVVALAVGVAVAVTVAVPVAVAVAVGSVVGSGLFFCVEHATSIAGESIAALMTERTTSLIGERPW